MAAQIPTSTNQLNETDFKLYIAIDFGTDGLGKHKKRKLLVYMMIIIRISYNI